MITSMAIGGQKWLAPAPLALYFGFRGVALQLWAPETLGFILAGGIPSGRFGGTYSAV